MIRWHFELNTGFTLEGACEAKLIYGFPILLMGNMDWDVFNGFLKGYGKEKAFENYRAWCNF